MPILDFKEIPQAHLANGEQDSLELLASSFFEYLGYKLIYGPSRGADGGKDLLLEETRTGVGGTSVIKWLVSCKHKAHSGSSVYPNDEQNVMERLYANKCDGIILFYTTIPSSGLEEQMRSVCRNNNKEISFYNKERIEKALLDTPQGKKIAERFFPKSMQKLINGDVRPYKVFGEQEYLFCNKCDKNILEPAREGHVEIEIKMDNLGTIEWFCEDCIQKRLDILTNDNYRCLDIKLITSPDGFMIFMGIMHNEIRNINNLSDKTYKNFKLLFQEIAPYALRVATEEEQEILGHFLNVNRDFKKIK
jgi:hypothetical protein